LQAAAAKIAKSATAIAVQNRFIAAPSVFRRRVEAGLSPGHASPITTALKLPGQTA